MNKLIIIGASGHGKVIADIAEKNGYSEIVFLDDNENVKECAGYPVIGRTSEVIYFDGDKIIAIGDSKTREKFQNKTDVVSLIHPNAVIGSRVDIGDGTVVMAGAVINSDAKIGRGCIINTAASVDHDCIIGDFSHVSVSAHLCGTVNVGEQCWIGEGSVVANNVDICSNVVIGAGAVVIKDIKEAGTYIGVPAKKMQMK